MSFRISRLYIVAGVLLSSFAHGISGQYELHIYKDAPTNGTVRLLLDLPLSSDHLFVTRELPGQPQELRPQCESPVQNLLVTSEGWIAPVGCDVITWEVAFDLATEPSVNVAEQRNLFYPDKWWLFTEWGRLLRPLGASPEWEFCFDAAGESSCRPVPSMHEPPLFLLLGRPDERVELDGTIVSFFTGHLPQGTSLRELLDAYRYQLLYLRSIAPSHVSQHLESDELDVLVLGIDAVHRAVGGAAGYSAYLANIAVDGDIVTATEIIRLLWVSGHELSHLLRIDGGPLWASEGLAHYYGFKSMVQTDEARSMFQASLGEAPQVGLLEGYRLYTHEGEKMYRALFYSRGAGFWSELDRVIRESTGGDVDLDTFLPILRGTPFGEAGELPQPFLDAVGEHVAESELNQILEQFL